MSQSSDDEVVGNRAWIDACKSRGHLQFWLINLLMTIPICFRLAFFSGEISYKPGRLVGFDDILTVGHLLQGCFCAGCLFLSHRFDAGSLCGGRFPRFKTCVLVCYTVSALVYPVYNLNKRLITSMPFFADSSYFSNQADFLLGLLIGYLLVSAFALFAHFYHRNHHSWCSPSLDIELRHWAEHPFMLVHVRFEDVNWCLIAFHCVEGVIVLALFFITLNEEHP
ncbi:unnamed protein product [Symbiodinium natans]|uniref:Transmembrane protein n=1 Tax=Symbiodinium natans TaxID=878477 RepID=A0A812MEZ8_9DINO|nr:unnamed protein product [Symbiodinium natans]